MITSGMKGETFDRLVITNASEYGQEIIARLIRVERNGKGAWAFVIGGARSDEIQVPDWARSSAAEYLVVYPKRMSSST